MKIVYAVNFNAVNMWYENKAEVTLQIYTEIVKNGCKCVYVKGEYTLFSEEPIEPVGEGEDLLSVLNDRGYEAVDLTDIEEWGE